MLLTIEGCGPEATCTAARSDWASQASMLSTRVSQEKEAFFQSSGTLGSVICKIERSHRSLSALSTQRLPPKRYLQKHSQELIPVPKPWLIDHCARDSTINTDETAPATSCIHA
jgi:hypothetical protein